MQSFTGGFQNTPTGLFGAAQNGLSNYRDRQRDERHDVFMQNRSHEFQIHRDAQQQQYHVNNTILGGAVSGWLADKAHGNTVSQMNIAAHHARRQSGIEYGQAKGLQNNAGKIAAEKAYQDHNIDMHKNEHNAVLEAKKTATERRAAAKARKEGMANIGQLSNNDRVESAQLGADGSLSVKTQRSSGDGATQSNASPAAKPKPVIGRGGVQSAGPTTEQKPSGSSSRAKRPKKAPVGGVGAPGAASRANHA